MDRDVVRKQLRMLRRGAGATALKLRDSPELMAALGTPTEPARSVAALRRRLEDLPDDERELLAVAFGFARRGAGTGLTERRGGQRDQSSWLRAENRAIDDLVELIASGPRISTPTFERTVAGAVRSSPRPETDKEREASFPSWLWPQSMTAAAEMSANEVWVITPDLYWDFQDPAWSELVRQNAAVRGVRYRYMYPDTPDNASRSADIIARLDHSESPYKSSRISFVGIPSDRFIWYAEHVIYDPGTERERAIIVDPWDSHASFDVHNVELGPDRRRILRRQFLECWNEHFDAT